MNDITYSACAHVECVCVHTYVRSTTYMFQLFILYYKYVLSMVSF